MIIVDPWDIKYGSRQSWSDNISAAKHHFFVDSDRLCSLVRQTNAGHLSLLCLHIDGVLSDEWVRYRTESRGDLLPWLSNCEFCSKPWRSHPSICREWWSRHSVEDLPMMESARSTWIRNECLFYYIRLHGCQ